MKSRLERVVRQTLDDRFGSDADLAAAIVAAVLDELRGDQGGETNPHVGWDEEPDDDTLDEFIAHDVESVHFEALDDCRWYANIKLADGQLWTLNFGSVTGRAKGYANAEQVE